MLPYVLVGLGAGAASSLLYLGAGVGSMLGFIAPLPLFIAGLGWRSLTSTIAAVSGAAVAAAASGFMAGLGYALAIGAPAVWLSSLALLARPQDPARPELGLEWYPVGRLVLWAAVLAAGLVVLTIPLLGLDSVGYEARLTARFAQALRQHGMADADARSVAEVLARVAPAVSAGVWMQAILLNLWAAGRIVRVSGRSQRPWPDLAGLSLPRAALFGLLAACAAMVVPGIARVAGSAFAAVFTVAFMLLGLAVMHAVTRGQAARPLILGSLYAGLVILPWTGLLLALLVLAEPLLKLLERRRGGAARPPGPRDKFDINS